MIGKRGPALADFAADAGNKLGWTYFVTHMIDDTAYPAIVNTVYWA